MSVQDLSKIRIAYKVQSALGSPASGAGARQLEVKPSSGLALQVASIESAMIRTSRMRKRPRHGSKSVPPVSYESELMVGAFDPAFEAVLGGTWLPSFTLDEVDFTSITISGTGTVITAGSGSFITEGIVAGMMGKFADLSEAGNNGKWFPILAVTATTLTIPSGILADNATDTACDLVIAKSLSTTTPYVDRYFTIEEYWATIDRAKIGKDMRWNKLAFDCQPDNPAIVSLGAGGRDMEILSSGSSPTFTDPDLVSGEELVLLDGGLYVNGVKRTNLTGLTFGLEAPVSTVPVIGTRLSPDVFLGQFALAGNFNVVVEDATDFDAFVAEDRISIFAHCAERGAAPAPFHSFYLGNLSFASFSTPAGGEGPTIGTLGLYGGEDDRGAGYAASSIVMSSSAT